MIAFLTVEGDAPAAIRRSQRACTSARRIASRRMAPRSRRHVPIQSSAVSAHDARLIGIAGAVAHGAVGHALDERVRRLPQTGRGRGAQGAAANRGLGLGTPGARGEVAVSSPTSMVREPLITRSGSHQASEARETPTSSPQSIPGPSSLNPHPLAHVTARRASPHA